MIRAKCLRLRDRGRLDLAVIDYAGLIKAEGKSPYERACNLSRDLKLLSKELDVPVMAAQQLSREPSHRKGNEPVLQDLRDSGSWEQDADVVLFLYQPENVVPVAGRLARTLKLAKQRNGPTGSIYAGMLENTTRFECYNIAPRVVKLNDPPPVKEDDLRMSNLPYKDN